MNWSLEKCAAPVTQERETKGVSRLHYLQHKKRNVCFTSVVLIRMFLCFPARGHSSAVDQI